MWMLDIAALVLLLSGASFGLNDDDPVNSTCPTWTIYDPQTNSCMCGWTIKRMVLCQPVACGFEVTMLGGFCMTLHKDQTEVAVGACPFISQKQLSSLVIPTHPSQLDTTVCGLTNRTGQLCGKCVNETSPPVYSYYPQCVNCTTSNWAKYMIVSLLPTTLFFLGAVAIRLRATAPHMNGFIFVCQMLASPPILRDVAKIYYVKKYAHDSIGIVGDIYISCFSIWNLDFFRMIYSPFCLHPNGSTLQVLSLDYITAVYPLALIILTYILVTLHYHNYRLVVCLWKPFLRCCIRFRRQWNIQNSLVDTFATFLLLSYVKFLSVSSDILAPTFMYNSSGRHIATTLYYDGSIEYFGKDHLPYAVLAITVLLVFTVLPILLLCLYPCRWFQRFLNSYCLRSQALYTFMDAFQGCYKDGTNGTRDCRYFAAIYLIARVAAYVSLVYTFAANTSALICLLVILMLLLSLFHPYKEWLYNQLDIFFCGSMIMLATSAWILHVHDLDYITKTDRVVLAIILPIPLVYSLCLVLYYIWSRSKKIQSVFKNIRACFSRPSYIYQPFQQSLPHRVVMNETTALLSRGQANSKK